MVAKYGLGVLVTARCLVAPLLIAGGIVGFVVAVVTFHKRFTKLKKKQKDRNDDKN